MKSNIPWVTWYILNYKTVAFFFFEVYFEGGTPKMYTNQLKDVCNRAHFFDKITGWGSAILPKYASLQVFFKIFDQICTVVIYKEFFEILRTSVSLKIF